MVVLGVEMFDVNLTSGATFMFLTKLKGHSTQLTMCRYNKLKASKHELQILSKSEKKDER